MLMLSYADIFQNTLKLCSISVKHFGSDPMLSDIDSKCCIQTEQFSRRFLSLLTYVNFLVLLL